MSESIRGLREHSPKEFVRKEIKAIIKAMDFCDAKGFKARSKKDKAAFYEIYQLLAYAWNEVGRLCKKHDYKYNKPSKRWICSICGKVKQ